MNDDGTSSASQDAVVSRRQSIGFAAAVAAAATAFGSADPAFAAYETQTQPSAGSISPRSTSSSRAPTPHPCPPSLFFP